MTNDTQHDPYEIIATVNAKAEKRTKAGNPMFAITLLEPGMPRAWDWTTFEEQAVMLEIGKTYRLTVERPPNPKGKYPYRNIREVLGEASPEMAAKPTPAAAPLSADYSDPHQASIEAQVCLKAAVDFLANDPEATVEQVVDATRIFYKGLQAVKAGHISDAKPPRATPSTGPAPSKATPDRKSLNNTGELMTIANKLWGSMPSDVVKALGLDSPSDINDPQGAFTRLVGLWGDPDKPRQTGE